MPRNNRLHFLATSLRITLAKLRKTCLSVLYNQQLYDVVVIDFPNERSKNVRMWQVVVQLRFKCKTTAKLIGTDYDK